MRLLSALFLFLAFAVSADMDGDFWRDHWRNDIAPWWLDAQAHGTPVGNFPTYRDLTGKPSQDIRYVRMLSRQVYTYSMGYMLTGDKQLFDLAKAGFEYLLLCGKDPNGGYYTAIDANCKPIPSVRTAQDQGYAHVGIAAYYMISRDTRAEAEIDKHRDFILRGRFWNNKDKMIRDAFDDGYANEVPFEGIGYDSVSILDQLNTYALMYYVSLPDGKKKDKVLNENKMLTDILVTKFLDNGIFWNTDLNRTDFNASHVDTGHTIKAYWLLDQVGKHWKQRHGGRHPYEKLIRDSAPAIMAAAYAQGPWGQRFDGSYDKIREFNPSWWINAELDQFAAIYASRMPVMKDYLRTTGAFWLRFVDTGRGVRGIREGIKQDGTLWGDVDWWDSKQNAWKNGYHETERAVMLYLLTGKQHKTLYFAHFEGNYTPYIFTGNAKTVRNESMGNGYDKVTVMFNHVSAK